MQKKYTLEALMRKPETAYLASDEEFDKRIDELGWSAKDITTIPTASHWIIQAGEWVT